MNSHVQPFFLSNTVSFLVKRTLPTIRNAVGIKRSHLPSFEFVFVFVLCQFEPKRQSYVGGPQTFSVTFDGNGFASKLTVR